MGPYGEQLHLYDCADPGIHSILCDLRALLDGYGKPDRVMFGEVHEDDWGEWARYYGPELDELHFPFNFGLLHVADGPSSVRRVVEAVESAMPPGAWPNFVLGNHDEHRVAARAGADLTPVLMMLLLTLRGTPTVYYGDELGLPDVSVGPEDVRDPWEHGVPGLGLGRDPQRAPMPWSTGANGGFCSAEVRPWLPPVDGYDRYSVAAQLDDPRSMLSLTRRLLRLRRARPILRRGAYRSWEASEGCVAYLRELGGKRLLVVLNFSGDEVSVALPEHGTTVASTNWRREGSAERRAIRLAPREGCVLELAGST
jgi:alpha-glucosidase